VGATAGGDGQTIGFKMRTGKPWLLNAIPSRLTEAAQGFMGGEPGRTGRFTIAGRPVSEAAKIEVAADAEVRLETPGGGGFGAP